MKMSRSMKNRKRSARSPLSVIPKRLHRDDQDLFGVQKSRISGHRVKSRNLQSDRRLPSTSSSQISTEGNFSRLVRIRKPATPERDFCRPSIDREVRVISERYFRRPSIERELRATSSERYFCRPSIDQELRAPSSERDFRRPSIDREVRVSSFERDIRISRCRDLRSRSTERHIRRTCLDRGSRRISRDRLSHERDSWRNSQRRTSRDREFTRTIHDRDFRKSSQERYERDGDFGHCSSEREFNSSFPSYPLSPDRGSKDFSRNSPIYYKFREQDSFQQRVSRSISPHIQPSEYLEENNSPFRNFDNSETYYEPVHDLPAPRSHSGTFSEAEGYTQRRSWDSNLAEGSHYNSYSPPQEWELPTPERQLINDLREEPFTSNIAEPFHTNGQNRELLTTEWQHFNHVREEPFTSDIVEPFHTNGQKRELLATEWQHFNDVHEEPFTSDIIESFHTNGQNFCRFSENDYSPERRRDVLQDRCDTSVFPETYGSAVEEGYRSNNTAVGQPLQNSSNNKNINANKVKNNLAKRRRKGPCRPKLNEIQHKYFKYYISLGYSLQDSYRLCMNPIPESTFRGNPDGSVSWMHPTEAISVEGNQHEPVNDVIPRLKLTGAQRRRLNWYVHQGYSLQESYNFCLKPFPDAVLENKAQKQFIC